MQNLLVTLAEVLKEDKRCVVEGELNKAKIEELGLELDAELLKRLMGHDSLKKHFFTPVGDVLVFDKIKFQKFINNKSFLPDSYTTFKNKIGLSNREGDFISESKEIVLSWPHKDCVLEGGQDKEDAKRNEVFFNEILAPDEIDHLLEAKALTNFKKYDKDGEHEVNSITYDDNLIIKGNNLLALHSLERIYTGKVKLIYIDPPYNTEDDSFQYNDRFTHATWLTFTKNRLEAAKKLLSNDGFIFVQCNDIECAYLKVLMDEVFGRENFRTSITVKMSHLSGPKMAHVTKKIPKIKETILMYSKSDNFELQPDYTPVSWDDAFDRYNSFVKKTEESPENWEIVPLKQVLKEHNLINDQEIYEFKINNSDKIFRTARNRGADYSSYPKDCFSEIAEGEYTYKHEDVYFASKKVREFAGELKPSSAVGDIWS